MKEKIIPVIIVILILSGLYLTSLYSYLLFHNIAELFSIIVACGIFMIAWNSRKYIKNEYLIFIAIAYLFIAGLDLLHTLSYKGMQIFNDYDYYANQLWIAARYLESATLLFAFTFIVQKKFSIKISLVFIIYTLITGIMIASIFYWKTFPICFVDGTGLTPFKKISEYIICTILVLDLILLYKYRQSFEKEVFSLLILSIFFTIVSELAFTFYISNYGFSNLIGHYFKIFSFYSIYKAIIQTGIVKPYDLIFRELVVKEKNLIDATKAADSANQAKSDFLANMSHELRTPLNGILGYAQILKRERDLKESIANGLDIIDISGRHLLNLINEILDLSKIEARKMELIKSNFLFSEFLKAIIQIIQIKTIEKGTDFYAELAIDLPRIIFGDEKRLNQILLNLLGNAAKFTETGTVYFRVWDAGKNDPMWKPSAANSRLIHFEVEDSGPGIAQNDIAEIFSPFKQVGKNKYKQEGSGLGLPITRQLVTLMGGELKVKSFLEKGSTFWFEIEVPEGSDINEFDLYSYNSITGYTGERKKIMIVDDNYHNRNVLKDILLPLDFEIDEAQDGNDCLNKVFNFCPDIIFMDIFMPNMNGFEAAEEIRKSNKLNTVKIIACSASVSLSHQEILPNRGLDDFITKPIELNELLKKMEYHLNITWIIDNPKEDKPNIKSDNEPSDIPPLEEIQKLNKLASGGDITGIRKHLDQLEKENHSYKKFINEIKKLAQTFQIRQIKILTQKYMDTVTHE
ncbi:MAG: response regulator [Desulfobacterales bacterium]|nr:response regulator [Desulfobacterales bacterium]